MANPQLIIGGAAVVINLATGGNPPGTTSPPQGSFSIWDGSTQVFPSTSFSSLPVTVNSVTCSAATINGSTGHVASLTLQALASCSLASYTGANVLAYGPNGTSYGPVDIASGSAPPAASAPRRRPPVVF